MKIKLLLVLLLFTATAHSQTRYPFGTKHKNIKTITLTNGKYDEFFDEDTLQRVGSSVININTKKITKVKLTQEEIDELENEQASRFLSVDPLTSKFAFLTPYQYASNTPIQAIDLDGLEKYLVIWDKPDKDKVTAIRIFSFIDANGNAVDNHFQQAPNFKKDADFYVDDRFYNESESPNNCYSADLTQIDNNTKFIYENAIKARSKKFTELKMVQRRIDRNEILNGGYTGELRKSNAFTKQIQTGFIASGTMYNNGISNSFDLQTQFEDIFLKVLNSKSGNNSIDQIMQVNITTTNANSGSAQKAQKDIMSKYKNAQVSIIYDDTYKSKDKPDKSKKSSSTDMAIDVTVLDTKREIVD